jgi:hypothetical protein
MEKLERLKVHQVIAQAVSRSGKSRTQIASEIGYYGAKVIKNYEEGALQVPLDKIGPLATALNLDPVFLLRLALLEYHPEIQGAIETLFGGRALLTQNEISLIQALRKLTDYSDPPFALETRGDTIEVFGVMVIMEKRLRPSVNEPAR